jgi:hypothetical protein
MDCEKFESAMMDELYGELDELTSAAAKRHVAGCARCSARLGGLRATRRVATLPLVEAPVGLEERILAAARDAQRVVPLSRRVTQAVSLAGSWAMRPQTAMAAVFLVMIGTSVLLLRGKAHEVASAPVTVTEQGTPAPPAASMATAVPIGQQPADQPASAMASAVAAAPPAAHLSDSKVAPPPAPIAASEPAAAEGSREQRWAAKAVPARAAPAPRPRSEDDSFGQQPQAAAAPAALPPPPAQQAGVPGGPGAGYGSGASRGGGQAAPFDTALAQYRAGQFDDAARAFDALAPGDPNAELWAARSVREGRGCRAAVTRFDRLAQRAQGTPPAWDALLEGALCFRALSNFGEARVRLNALLRVDSHKDRARAELDRLDQVQQGQANATPPAAKAAPKAAAPASPPAATSTGTSY